jgi:ABC-2 type transport system ATP-binding protein
MILELRDEGRTVLFSSHILSDAELLCSRVGILSQGQLVRTGTIGDLTSGETRGWEVVVTDTGPALIERLTGEGLRVRPIAEGRFSLLLGSDRRPEPLVAELAGAGAKLVSVSPVRTTLEDVFLQALGREDAPDDPAGRGGRDR